MYIRAAYKKTLEACAGIKARTDPRFDEISPAFREAGWLSSSARPECANEHRSNARMDARVTQQILIIRETSARRSLRKIHVNGHYEQLVITNF